MKILLASSEVHPYSKSGGLADMVGALGKTLGRAGHEVGLVSPLYSGILEKFPDIKKTSMALSLPLGSRAVQAEVWSASPSTGLTLYFIQQPEFFERAGLYGEHGFDYPDNPQRFIFFSKCVAHLARHLTLKPEIVHLHDWQTGLVPVFILHQKLTEGWGSTPRTVFTIHNLAYQGSFPSSAYQFTNLPPDYFNLNGLEFYGQLNCMKAGIVYSDIITTVSPRYAREITTPAFGCALDPVLRLRQESLYGILNGVDYEEWNTEANPNLKHAYSAAALEGKAAAKADLQKEFGLPVDLGVPLFGNITRLADQKGVDILLGALEEMLAANMQFVLLGSGFPDYEAAYAQLAKRYPSKVSIRLGFNQALSHRIEAGSDFFLMPSRYEPCGLNQMYSLRYGTIPIVRITGGLDDSVVDINEDAEHANGIKFGEYSVRALAKAIRKALVLYENPDLLFHYRENGMQADFSWDRTASEYGMVYEEAMRR
jgi:starch synthase